MMTSLSNWGRWGKQDELGALNLITPQKRKSAAAEVKEGMAISMARNAIKVATEGSPAFEHRMITTGQDPKSTGASDAYSAQYHGYTLTHMDVLCHLFYKGKMYNGFSQQEVTDKGAGKLSVINTKDGLFTRAVLMDMPRLTGLKFLKGQTAIYGLWSALPLPTALTGLYGLAAPCFFRWNGAVPFGTTEGSRNCNQQRKHVVRRLLSPPEQISAADICLEIWESPAKHANKVSAAELLAVLCFVGRSGLVSAGQLFSLSRKPTDAAFARQARRAPSLFESIA